MNKNSNLNILIQLLSFLIIVLWASIGILEIKYDQLIIMFTIKY